MKRLRNRCVAVAAGLLLDRVLGEPPTALHPVAWFGTVMGRVEHGLWADRRRPGFTYAATGLAIGVMAGAVVHSTSAAVAIAAAGRALRSTAHDVGRVTESGDLDLARTELRALVGRDPSSLDPSGISAAVIESVAENSVDAVIAPVFWALAAGAPGALAYRAVNTMDAMVGHRNDRYRHFGTAAARLDDMANWIPARLFAGLVAIVKPGDISVILRTVRRDAPSHPSPNAGVAESAMAAVLGRQLGGPLRYGDRVERRPALGNGPRPNPADIATAVQIANRVELLTVGLLVGTAAAFRRNL
ncbi:MAG: adenosylcobinamide-phosphate synthase CbiB [Acidimicrobiales bacterium]